MSYFRSLLNNINYITNGLISWWKLDETSGILAYDSIGTNNGTLINSPTRTSGKINNAVSLNGSSQYISINSGFIGNMNAFTICAWIKPGTQQRGDVYSEGNSGTNTQLVRLSINETSGTENNISFDIRDNVSQELKAVSSNVGVQDGNWHFICGICYSKSSIAVFFDGNQVGSDTSTTISTLTLDRNTIGALGRSGYAIYYNGIVDDVRIYNRALTQSEITKIYNLQG